MPTGEAPNCAQNNYITINCRKIAFDSSIIIKTFLMTINVRPGKTISCVGTRIVVYCRARHPDIEGRQAIVSSSTPVKPSIHPRHRLRGLFLLPNYFSLPFVWSLHLSLC